MFHQLFLGDVWLAMQRFELQLSKRDNAQERVATLLLGVRRLNAQFLMFRRQPSDGPMTLRANYGSARYFLKSNDGEHDYSS